MLYQCAGINVGSKTLNIVGGGGINSPHPPTSRYQHSSVHGRTRQSGAPTVLHWCANSRLQRLVLTASRWARDGNGYPKPETRWVFTPLGYGFGSIFIPMGLLMGINVYPTGSWVRVCSYSTQTREPVGFLNPTKPSAYCHFIL